MPLKVEEAAEKFDLAINHIKGQNTKIIDFSGIPLTKEQLDIIVHTLTEAAFEPFNEEDSVPFAGEEYKHAEPLSKGNEVIESILMNGCGLTNSDVESIQSIFAVTKLHSLGLDDNDLDGSALFDINSYYVLLQAKKSEARPIKIWARSNYSYDKYKDIDENADVIEFEIDGESVAQRINKIVEDDQLIAEFEDEVLSIDNLKKLEIAIKNNPEFSELSLSGVKLDAEAAKAVAGIIESHPSLSKLFLDNCALNDEGLEILYPALLSCKKLTTLFLDDNNITAIGAQFIARLLAFNNIPYLDLNNNPTFNIQYLTLNNNPIGDRGVASLSAVIPSNQSLLYLELRSCLITAEGAIKLIGALHSNKKLQRLILTDNHIGDAGLKDLQVGNSFLQYLCLDKCDITDLGAKFLAATFLKNKMPLLHMLDVSHNKITENGINGIDGLAAALTVQTNLEFCALSGNPIGDASMVAIAGFVKSHFKLSELELEECNLTTAGIKILARALKSNPRLEKISLNKNTIDDNGAVVLAKMLSENCNLEQLPLKKTGITTRGATAIYEAIIGNSRSIINSVDVRKNLVSEQDIEALQNMFEDDDSSESENSSKQDQDIDQKSSTSEDTVPLKSSAKLMLTQANSSFSYRGKLSEINSESSDTDADPNTASDTDDENTTKKLKNRKDSL
jgi:Ran GTPase-activating protein (RanGAP) involved in mRNA processing and transport